MSLQMVYGLTEKLGLMAQYKNCQNFGRGVELVNPPPKYGPVYRWQQLWCYDTG